VAEDNNKSDVSAVQVAFIAGAVITLIFVTAGGKRIEKIEERLDRLENQVRPRIKAVNTENGIRFVLENAGADRWINPKYMDAVLEDVGLELSELDVKTEEGGDSESYF